jgi:MarR family
LKTEDTQQDEGSIKKADYISCSHCNGEGYVEMTGVYAKTLELLRKQPAPLNAVELAKLAKCNPTAMNNRLARLEGHGLAERQRYGRESLC